MSPPRCRCAACEWKLRHQGEEERLAALVARLATTPRETNQAPS